MSTAGTFRSESALSARDREILLGLAARIEPGDAGGHNNLGVLYFNRGMVPEAVDQFHSALEMAPGMTVARRNLEIAYLASGYHIRLRSELTARLDEDPADGEIRWRLLRMYRYAGPPDEARAELRKLLVEYGDDPRYLLELGRMEKEAGAVDVAREAFERGIAADPENPVLHYELGDLLYHRGASGEARRFLTRAIELSPRLAEAHHLLSVILSESGERDAAEAALERARKLGVSFDEAQGTLSIDRHSEARYRELVGERVPRPVALGDRFLARYHRGIALRQKGLYGEALREFDQALDGGEDRTLVLQAKAEVLLVTGKDAEATRIYQRLLDDSMVSPKVWNELGVCRHRIGDLAGAAECYRRALELDPDYVLAENNLAVAGANRGDATSARLALEALVTRRPEFLDARYNLGLLALEGGRYREALRAFRAVVDADPTSAPGWLGIGAVLAETGELSEARGALARAIEIDPEAAEARYRLGFVLSRLGDVAGSLRETRRALALNPYFTNPRPRLAIELQFEYADVLAPELAGDRPLDREQRLPDFLIDAAELSGVFRRLRGADGTLATSAEYSAVRDYLARGMLDRAMSEVRGAVLGGGDPVEGALLTGEIFRRQGVEGEALERFDAAIGRLEGQPWTSRHERAWLGRGWSLVSLGRFDDAAEAAATVLAADPGSSEAVRLEAESLLRSGRHAAALQRFRQLVDAAPGDPPLLVRIGAAARGAGWPEEARAALIRALELDPDLVAAHVELGRLCLDRHDYDEAAGHGRRALAALPGYGEAALLVADAERAAGRLMNAVEALADLLADDPYHLDALRELGTILLQADRPGDAAVALRRAVRFEPDSVRAWEGLATALAAGGDFQGAADCRHRAEQIASTRTKPAAAATSAMETVIGRERPARRTA